jgi:hypothetical protein
LATSRKKNLSILENIKDFTFSNNVFPFVLIFTTLGILFVLFRMKNVEVDYRSSSMRKDIEKFSLENKELKAKKAKLLSTKRLRQLAKKYKLQQPVSKQIIVIK